MIGNRGLRPPEETPQQGPKQLVQKVSLKWWDEANAECTVQKGVMGGACPWQGQRTVLETLPGILKRPLVWCLWPHSFRPCLCKLP